MYETNQKVQCTGKTRIKTIIKINDQNSFITNKKSSPLGNNYIESTKEKFSLNPFTCAKYFIISTNIGINPSNFNCQIFLSPLSSQKISQQIFNGIIWHLILVVNTHK